MDLMWKQIVPHVTFEGKTVLDIGCGFGDFVVKCANANAYSVTGWEIDDQVRNIAEIKTRKFMNVAISGFNAEFWHPTVYQYDIVGCFSVLPYMNYPRMLRRIRTATNLALIECQYAGDGPGLPEIHDDSDMEALLRNAGFEPEAIGKTLAKESWWRTIWLCR